MRISISVPIKVALTAILAVTLLFGAGSFAPAKAATFLVNTSADDNSVNGNCSLREAIRAAVTHTAVDACPSGTGNDMIVFNVSSVTVNAALPTITAGNTVTIYGGSGKITLNVNIPTGTLFVSKAGSTLTVQNVNIAGSGSVCFQSAGNLNIINDSIACSQSIVATAGQVNVQLSTSHMIDTHSGNAVLNVSTSSLVGGVPYTLNIGAGGGTVTHTSFGAGQVHISTTGPLTVSYVMMNNVGTAGGIVAAGATVTVKNTIIAGTTQTAIDPEVGGQFIIINSTIVNNTYGLNGTSGTISLKNTILANTTNCYPGAGFTLIDNGGNLESTPGCGTIPVGNPQLGRGFIPQAGSPVIDGGLNAGCLSDDFYGTIRPIDGDANGTVICDIGAVEKA